jgi:predicted PurR-regulated permease PerM
VAIPFLAVMASAAFCYFARPILVPLVVALTLAYLLAPAVDVLTRKLPRPLSVLLVVAAAGLLLGALGFLLVDQGQSLARSAPEYWRLLKVRLGEPSTWPGQLPDPLASLLANILPDLQSQLGDIDWRAVTGSLFAGLGSLLGFLGWAVLVALLALFILLDLPRMRQQLVLAMGPNHQAAMNEALTDIDRQLRTFLAVKIGISGALGVVATVGLLTFGVPYAWVWGPLVGILNIIPYLGALISSVPPVVMVALDQQSLWPGLWVAAFLILLQQLEGNFITPKVMGDRIQLNVVAVLLASMIWGWLWGAMGVLLAIPITAALKVVCERIEPLRPIAVLLG